ncbi:universal stress protein [Roseovarius arcticus]|uniref:universal stress protein n=1 Tax=Roseovarius arcticus TaxID=2547404 RepID=UPI001110E588|nr:universal stress protein [Roseovarius arcticus]
MAIKTIVVGLMTAEDAEWLVPAACAVANTYGSHLIGVHPVEANLPYVSVDGMVSDLSGPMFYDWQIEETAAIKATFDRLTRVEDFVAEWRTQDVRTTDAASFLTGIARNADLVMIGQPDTGENRRNETALYENVIRQSGRPVLMVPRGHVIESIGQHFLFGWSDTDEAARAVHDAMTLAKPDAQVDILYVGHDSQDSAAGPSARRDLAAAIDRHRIKTELITSSADAEGIAATLLRHAFERGCDTVVTGAFGHSRTYDFVIGAVTHELMEKATLPVLLAK